MDTTTISERSQLKKNLLGEKLEGSISWVAANRSKVFTGVGVFFAAFLILSVLFLRRKEQVDLAWVRMAQAQSFLSQKQYPASRQILEELKNASPSSQIHLMSVYFLADVSFKEKKYDEAILDYSQVISDAGKNPIKPLALSALGFVQEEKKDFAAASQTYQQFIDQYSDHFLAPRIQLSLGRTQLLAGNAEGAKKTLGHLVDLFPKSSWADAARELLKKI